jgi:hypothetical protein
MTIIQFPRRAQRGTILNSYTAQEASQNIINEASLGGIPEECSNLITAHIEKTKCPGKVSDIWQALLLDAAINSELILPKDNEEERAHELVMDAASFVYSSMGGFGETVVYPKLVELLEIAVTNIIIHGQQTHGNC